MTTATTEENSEMEFMRGIPRPTEWDLEVTLENIDNIDSFEIESLKEATRQAELRVNDENARKVRIDTRAYTLLSVSVGLIGVIATMISKVEQIGLWNVFGMGATTLILGLAAVFAFLALRPVSYAPLGTLPSQFLKTDLISVNKRSNKALGRALSVTLFGTHKSLIYSDESNNNRLKWLNRALNTIIAV